MGQPTEAEQELTAGRLEPVTYQPTQVVYCTWGRERGSPPLPLASFDWSAEGGVQFTVLDYERGRSARRFMVDGAVSERERRVVRPEEGPVFMRALLGHGNSSSYYWFLDKTPGGG